MANNSIYDINTEFLSCQYTTLPNPRSLVGLEYIKNIKGIKIIFPAPLITLT
jgi:hypothetical protein